jgi:hypothetical protein
VACVGRGGVGLGRWMGEWVRRWVGGKNAHQHQEEV